MSAGKILFTFFAATIAPLWLSFFCSCSCTGHKGHAEGEVVIISPHDESIRFELSRGFADYSKKRVGRALSVRWRPARGTGNIIRFLENEMRSAAGGREMGIDLLLGGGAPAHEKAARMGATQPIDLSLHILDALPQELGGVNLRSKTGHWIGVTLGTFGIIYNKSGLRKRGISPPRSWKDLADPAFAGLLVLADPLESGSARASYEMILQHYGWTEGWKVLHRIMANCGSFTHSASDIPRAVSTGQAVAGIVIDSYAYVQVKMDGEDHIGFVLPEGETTFTPDPVSIMKGTVRIKEALLFVEFLLSEEGQRLWILPPGELGGPAKYSLMRLPVRPSVYKTYRGKLTIAADPFESVGGLKYDEKKGNARAHILALLFDASSGQNRKLLKEAWKKIRERGDGRRADLFDMVPMSEEEALKISEKERGAIASELLEEKLYQLFKSRYLEVIHYKRR